MMPFDGVDAIRHRRRKREEREESEIKHTRFSRIVENERAGAGHESRTCLARLYSQLLTGAGKMFIADLKR